MFAGFYGVNGFVGEIYRRSELKRLLCHSERSEESYKTDKSPLYLSAFMSRVEDSSLSLPRTSYIEHAMGCHPERVEGRRAQRPVRVLSMVLRPLPASWFDKLTMNCV